MGERQSFENEKEVSDDSMLEKKVHQLKDLLKREE